MANSKNISLKFYVRETMTGIIRDYDQKENKIKAGKKQGQSIWNDSFRLVSGDNSFTVVKTYTKDNLVYEDKEGNKNKTFLSADIEKIKIASKTQDNTLYTINTVPFYSYYESDGELKTKKLPEFRGFDKINKTAEGTTFVIKAIVNKIKDVAKIGGKEIELGFVESSKNDDFHNYKWITVYIEDAVYDLYDSDVFEIGSFISIGGNVFNCFNVDEFGHSEGDSKSGHYVSKIYLNECIETGDITDEDKAFYNACKKAGKIDQRPKTETKGTKAPAKATRSFDDKEEDEDDI